MQVNNLSFLQEFPLIAILRGLEKHRALDVAACLIEQGFSTLEVPLNTDEAFDAIHLITKNYQDKALIGAGTVLNTQQIARIADIGAQFSISPNTNAEVIREAKRRQLLSIPGCMTPSEAICAIESGADALKFFPAHALSPSACKAIIRILPKQVPVFVVGGVAISDLASYLKAGICGFGIGEMIFTPQMNLKQIEQQAQSIVEAFKAVHNTPLA